MRGSKYIKNLLTLQPPRDTVYQYHQNNHIFRYRHLKRQPLHRLS